MICVAVTGCSERKVATTKQPTVESAKAAVLAEEKRLVSFLPSQYVERLDQLNTAHLLSCTGGGYTWPDQAEVTLKGSPDTGSLLDDVARGYRKLPHFTLSMDKTSEGADRLTVSNDDGASYLVSPWKSNTALRITSFSVCFNLRADQWPGGAY